jgi:hypothetical protein
MSSVLRKKKFLEINDLEKIFHFFAVRIALPPILSTIIARLSGNYRYSQLHGEFG